MKELGSSSTKLLFIPGWTEIVQRRMAALPIVKDLNILKDGLPGLLARLVGVPSRPLPFERPNEALRGGVVVAIAFAAHTDLDASVCKQGW